MSALYSFFTFRFLLFCIILIPELVWAADIIVWKQHPQSAGIIFPKKENQTKAEAISEYFYKINNTKSLSGLLEQSEIQSLRVKEKLPFNKGEFFDLKPAGHRPRFIIVTNELRELYGLPFSKRIQNIKKRLEMLGAEVFVLPVVHDLTLPIHEAKEFRKKIIAQFDAQLVLGGADIDPYLYGEKSVYARYTIRHRDLSELKFVRAFIAEKKGMNFGICRGHQMCAVANHKKLFQDIQEEIGASKVHLDGEHFIKVDDSSEIFSIFDSKKLLVNSLHHQAVIVPKNDETYKVVATSFDKKPVIEALEFRNAKGYTLQFHPELMFNETGDKIMKRFVDLTIKNKALENAPVNCRQLIKKFF